MTAVFVQGRPLWSANEPIEVQRLVVEHKLTAIQLQALREFATAPEAPRIISHSTARALRSRNLGEITGKQTNRQMDRDHPKAEFVLNAPGRILALALRYNPEHEAPRVPDVSYRNEHGARRRWDKQPKPPREKSKGYRPAEWDE